MGGRHFQRRGRGVYACAVCGRNTRSTGDSVDLCAQCYEIAGLDNEVNDRGLNKASKDYAVILSECESLLAKAVELGGNESYIRKYNEYVWPKEA